MAPQRASWPRLFALPYSRTRAGCSYVDRRRPAPWQLPEGRAVGCLAAAAALRVDNWQQFLPTGSRRRSRSCCAWQVVQLVWIARGRAGPAAACGPDSRDRRTPARRIDSRPSSTRTCSALPRRRATSTVAPRGHADEPGAGRHHRADATPSRAARSSATARSPRGSMRSAQDLRAGREAAFGLPRPRDPRPGRQARSAAAAEAVPGGAGGGMPGPRRQPPGGAPNAMLGDQHPRRSPRTRRRSRDIMRPQPVFANGQQRGYRVYPGPQPAAVREPRPDAGRPRHRRSMAPPSTTRLAGMEILQSHRTARRDVTVTVERNGQTSQISINNALVAADAAAAAAAPVRTMARGATEPRLSRRTRSDDRPDESPSAMSCSSPWRRSALAPACCRGSPPPGPGPGRDHAELQGRRPLADHRGRQRGHGQEFHRRPARARAGDDAVVDADDAGRVLRGLPRRSCRCMALSPCPRAT